MPSIKLSVLSILLGLGFALPQIFGLLNPQGFAESARKFSRSLLWGYVLMAVATFWFLYYLNLESVSDFAAYKPMMLGGFFLLSLLTCIYVSDFLAVRGLALVLMLLAKLMLDTARWHESEWRLVIIIWAYLLIFFGMWFTIAPWRLRDFLNAATRSEHRIRVGSALRLAFALFVVLLGLVVF